MSSRVCAGWFRRLLNGRGAGVVSRRWRSPGEAGELACDGDRDGFPPLVRRYSGRDGAVYENPIALARASVAPQVVVTARRAGLVLLDDSLADGWRVRVDGHPAAALRVDDVLRGVVVGSGSHEIAWTYTVPGLRAGALLSLLALATLGGAGVVLVRRRRAAGR